MLQSSKNVANVKAHLSCSHLEAAIQRQKARDAIGCMGGRENGLGYCDAGAEVDCPGSNEKCGISINKPCCTNPCPGVHPFPDADTFPCPSNPTNAPASKTCDTKDKVESCLDPCAPTPAPSPPVTPSPTSAPPSPPTKPMFKCTREDLDNFPSFKAMPGGYQCATGSTCYSTTDIETCRTFATCYAKENIGTCKSGSNCCAAGQIDLCSAGATCYASKFGKCEKKSICVQMDLS